MSRYTQTRNTRRESRTLLGRFRAGVLAPVMAVPVRGNEGGLLSQNISLELDPIAGRLITPVWGEMISVFVPVPAIDAIKNPEADYAGLTDVIRQKLLTGNPLFGLEDEGEISKRCGVNPRSIGGQKKVNEMVRLAHNAAVNYLRQRKYVKATKVLANSTAITPALISDTVLDRLNGVLDPDDRINGQVELDLPNMILPVTGIKQSSNAIIPLRDNNYNTKLAMGSLGGQNAIYINARRADLMDDQNISFKRKDGNPAGTDLDINAVFSGASAGGVSLVDFYNAEQKDKLTRIMRQIVDDNPEYGEEYVLRWAHGLSIDNAKVPFVIHEQRLPFQRGVESAMDTEGVEAQVQRTDNVLHLGFSVPVPRTELGGIVITFACLKPDETISSQPHPFLSDNWGAENFVADELALDPVPVTLRELDSDIAAAQESTVVLYTGLNALKQTYVSYGLNRHLDPETVENKTVIWQLDLPLSVTPDTILYPANLPQYPFADQLAEVCTYVVSSICVLQTPMIIGPTPVEELEVLNDNDLFEDEE